jgi:hypothetical protein
MTEATSTFRVVSYQPTGALYRHFDSGGTLLYVGSTETFKLRSRHLGHVRTGRWWAYVARIEVEEIPKRRDAYLIETAAIHAERPIFNSMGSTPEREAREAAYVDTHEPGAVEEPATPRWRRTEQLDRILRDVGLFSNQSLEESA